MANAKFTKVLELIKGVLGLLADLLPIADDALNLINRVREIVAEYKAEKGLIDDYQA